VTVVSRLLTRPRGRWIGIGIAAAILLGIGTYLPLTLLAPIKAAVADVELEQPPVYPAASYTLPVNGISAFGLQEIEDPGFWWRVGHPGIIWGDW
jgi:hypothetical protein